MMMYIPFLGVLPSSSEHDLCLWEAVKKLEANLQQAAAKSCSSFHACLCSLSRLYLPHTQNVYLVEGAEVL